MMERAKVHLTVEVIADYALPIVLGARIFETPASSREEAAQLADDFSVLIEHGPRAA